MPGKRVFSFAAALFCSGCVINDLRAPGSAEDMVAGFVPPVASDCQPGEVLCPFHPQEKDRTSYCRISYERTLGFGDHCAPLDFNVCRGDSCQRGGTKVLPQDSPPINWKMVAQASKIAEVGNLPEIEQHRQALGPNNVTSGILPYGQIAYLHYLAKGVQYISFRGTKNFDNWLINIDVAFEKAKDLHSMPVHRGTYWAAQSALSALLPLIEKNRGRPIVISAHSLGGAIGMVLAMLLVEKGFAISFLLTLGQPHVTDEIGAAIFRKYYAAKIPFLRIVNQNDIVPELMWTLDQRYAHVGDELLIGLDHQKTFGFRHHSDGIYVTSLSEYSFNTYHNRYPQALAPLFTPKDFEP